MSDPVKDNDPVNHPAHYTQHPAGIECIDVVEHMPYNIGAAVKYLFRFEHKGNPIQDLRKAIWYIERQIKKIQMDAEREARAESYVNGLAGQFAHEDPVYKSSVQKEPLRFKETFGADPRCK